jgi:predicted PurR-regulated permease PerM
MDGHARWRVPPPAGLLVGEAPTVTNYDFRMALPDSARDRAETSPATNRSRREDLSVRRGLKIGLGITAIVGGSILLWYTAQVLLVFFASIFLAVFFSGLGRFLEKNTRFTYPACVAFSLIGLLLVLVVMGLLVGPAIASQSTHLADALPKAHQELLDGLKGSPWGTHVLAGLQRAMAASKDSNWQNTLKFAGLTIHGFGGLVFAVVIGIFLAFQPELYRTGLLNLFPRARRRRLAEVLDELGFTLWWWLMGQLVTMASVGTFIGVGLAVLGVPLAGTLGLIAAVLSFIPSLGPLISVIPALMMGLTISPLMALWVALLYGGVQILEANVITPLVQRKAISLPPAFVLGSELLMGLLLGGAGLAFATPLAAVILVLVNMLYIQDFLREAGSLPSLARREKR